MHDDHATISQLMFRMPEHLHEQLEEQASANHRSLNAEVVARLQASLDAADGNTGAMRGPTHRKEKLTQEPPASADA